MRRPALLLFASAALLLLLVAVLPHACADEASAPEDAEPPTETEEEPAAEDEGDDGEETPAEETETAPVRTNPGTCAPAEIPADWTPPEPEFEVPAGMVGVTGRKACIGSEPRTVSQLLQGRPPEIVEQFLFETPAHDVTLPDYCIDRYEVTNAQYHVFLLDQQTTYDTTKGGLANLQEVAGYLIGMPRDEWENDNTTWRMLYEANKEQLQEKMPNVPAPQGFKRAPLVRGLVLRFTKVRPPQHWGGMAPPEAILDHPVRWVSYDEASLFAQWAGKHIPTEQEWEYAARGPQRWRYPWGDTWFPDTSHLNWGGKITGDDYRPTTVAVDAMPEGASPFGLHHMLGNVEEWTSSWFRPYPGNPRENGLAGSYVKVLRGASLLQPDTLALRAAVRNFIGVGVYAPPRPSNRFEWSGFRCAWYPAPGRDLVAPTLRRALRYRAIEEARLDLTRLAGAEATHFLPPGTEVANHVYVTGQAAGILLLPFGQLLEEEQKEPRIRDTKDLVKESGELEDPLPLAVLHTDIPLEGVWVRDFDAERDEDGRRRRRSKGPEAPPVKKGDVEAGTYLLAMWHERVAVVTPAFEFQCFLTKEGEEPLVEVDKRDRDEAMAATSISVLPSSDKVTLSFAMPVSGKGAHERLTLTVYAELPMAKGALDAAGSWRAD